MQVIYLLHQEAGVGIKEYPFLNKKKQCLNIIIRLWFKTRIKVSIPPVLILLLLSKALQTRKPNISARHQKAVLAQALRLLPLLPQFHHIYTQITNVEVL